MFRTRAVLAQSINRVSLVGVVRDLQHGAINDVPCLQFMLVTQDIDAPQQGGAPSPTDNNVPLARRLTGFVKQQFCVRCTSLQEDAISKLRLRLEEGQVIKCIGQLRLNSQMESGKRRAFPYVAVPLGDPTKGMLVLPPKRQRHGGDV